jgi:hypothetical protein
MGMKMPHTFEELVGRDLDSLYRGALFLTGGHDAAAEDLLLGTFREAFHSYRTADVPAADAARWLEGCLAARALVELRGMEPPKIVPKQPLYRGAAAVPVGARVALWLVLMRRWSYEAAGERLKVDRAGLRDLLRHRERLNYAMGSFKRSTEHG